MAATPSYMLCGLIVAPLWCMSSSVHMTCIQCLQQAQVVAIAMYISYAVYQEYALPINAKASTSLSYNGRYLATTYTMTDLNYQMPRINEERQSLCW